MDGLETLIYTVLILSGLKSIAVIVAAVGFILGLPTRGDR